MKMNPRPLSAIAAAALTMSAAMADTVMTVSTAGAGSQYERIDVSEIGKVTFSDGKFSVYGEETTPFKAFDISNICKISFSQTDTSVKGPAGDNASLRLLRNPVEDFISVEGVRPGSDAVLFDLQGRTVMNVASWNGEDIDVSALPSGAYLLKVNSQTIKVIKK